MRDVIQAVTEYKHMEGQGCHTNPSLTGDQLSTGHATVAEGTAAVVQASMCLTASLQTGWS
jgi:hypothetical protein